MSDEITEQVLATAREAKCMRCGIPVVDAPTVTGTVMLNYYVPALGKRERLYFCGEHGLELREFLYPHIKEDPVYVEAKASALALSQEAFQRRSE